MLTKNQIVDLAFMYLNFVIATGYLTEEEIEKVKVLEHEYYKLKEEEEE